MLFITGSFTGQIWVLMALGGQIMSPTVYILTLFYVYFPVSYNKIAFGLKFSKIEIDIHVNQRQNKTKIPLPILPKKKKKIALFSFTSLNNSLNSAL